MRLTGCEEELLRTLASMPFLDRLEMVAVSGWSRGAVYEGVRRLEAREFAASVPHAADLIPPTRRYHLTAAGLRRLAQADGVSVDDLLRSRPVSAQWRRILLERLDAVAVIYRLASAISNAVHPIRLRLYRAKPMDAAILLPGGRTVAVVRQGLTSDRTGFSKRLWRLREGGAHRRRPPAHARRDAAEICPQAARRLPRARFPRAGARRGLRRPRRPGMASARRQRDPRSPVGAGPDTSRGRSSNGTPALAGDPSRL